MTYALVVGIENYQQPGIDISGPAENAVSIAEWLVEAQVARPEHVRMFVAQRVPSAASGGFYKEMGERLGVLRVLGVQVTESATYEDIDAFCSLALCNLSGPQLFVYWSGHGFSMHDGRRVFLCQDYQVKRPQNVFSASNFLQRLRTDEFQFGEQIILADACGTYPDFVLDPRTAVLGKPVNGQVPTQTAYFATREGEFADADGPGTFTRTALDILRSLNTFPAPGPLAASMRQRFADKWQRPFRVSGIDADGELLPKAVGRAAGSSLHDNLYDELSRFPLTGSVCDGPFALTIANLGLPELGRADGLLGKLSALAATRSDANDGGVSAGLVQFLVRLSERPELKVTLNGWLAKHASQLSIASAREILAEEQAERIVLVHVLLDDQSRMRGFDLLVCTADTFTLCDELAINVRPEAPLGWSAFCVELDRSLVELQKRVPQFQLQFLVDARLFDRLFHQIRRSNNEIIGEGRLVVVRYVPRLRLEKSRSDWVDLANFLRTSKPAELEVVPLDLPPSPEGIVTGKGFCYTRFVVAPSSAEQFGAPTPEKELLLKAVKYGVPFLHLVHSTPAEGGFAKVEAWLRETIRGLDNLHGYPGSFNRERQNNRQLAYEASLLWDDPLFNPFWNTREMSIK